MAHKIINGKVVVDWTTGDHEGDRLHLLNAYKDFIGEIHWLAKKWVGNAQGVDVILSVFDKWHIDTEGQIDEVPRIWIKRPE